MTDESVVFTPRFMLGVMQKMQEPANYFLNTFSEDADPIDQETIDLDKESEKRSTAPYVNPLDEATKVALAGYNTHTLKLPYQCEQVVITPKDLQSREAGTTIYDPLGTYGQRAEKMAGKALKTLERRFANSEELALAKGLTTGKIPIVGPKINAELDLKMPAANIVTLTGQDLWNDYTAANPIENLRTWKRVPQDSGGRLSTKAIMGAYAAKDFLNCAKLASKLDNRRIIRGEISIKQLADQYIEYLGIIDEIDIFVNHAKYIDTAGVEQYFMPPTKVLMAPEKSRVVRHYGPVYNLKNMMVVKRYPSSWVREDGKARIVQLETSCLPIPWEIEDFVCAEVTEVPE